MGDVIEFNQKRFFTLGEARALLPVVRRVTESSFREVKALTAQLNYVTEPAKKADVEERIRNCFQDWFEKIGKLGAQSKGMWLVDFDNGEGYYCWHYPEPDIHYFHGYLEGFQGRKTIDR